MRIALHTSFFFAAALLTAWIGFTLRGAPPAFTEYAHTLQICGLLLQLMSILLVAVAVIPALSTSKE